MGLGTQSFQKEKETVGTDGKGNGNLGTNAKPTYGNQKKLTSATTGKGTGNTNRTSLGGNGELQH